MAEKLFSYADKQVMDEVGSGGGGGQDSRSCFFIPNGPSDVTCNMTFSELTEFLNNGNSNVFLKMAIGDEDWYLHCARYNVESDIIGLQFIMIDNLNNYLVYYTVVFEAGADYIEYDHVSYNLTAVE